MHAPCPPDNCRPVLLTGDRTTGPLRLGHIVGLAPDMAIGKHTTVQTNRSACHEPPPDFPLRTSRHADIQGGLPGPACV